MNSFQYIKYSLDLNLGTDKLEFSCHKGEVVKLLHVL